MMKRYLTSGVGALAVTISLGVIMTALIKLPYQELAEKSERLVYEVNPFFDDEVIINVVELPKLRVVVPPPPAPVLTTKGTELPIEKFVSFGEQIPHIERPQIKLDVLGMSLVQAGGPVVRVPPIMPTRATRSGHCDMEFDVNADGVTYNVRAISCSEQVFKTASIKSVQKWKYRPSMDNGQSSGFRAVRTTITFNLQDEHGNKIPE